MYTGTQVNRFARLAGFCGLIFTLLACEPVIAIGWKEILFVVILLAFLFGPPVYRFIRRIENSLKQKDK
jgi:hypothetical protein